MKEDSGLQNLASLTFNTEDAKNKLQALLETLNTTANLSEKNFKEMADNFQKIFANMNINTNSFSDSQNKINIIEKRALEQRKTNNQKSANTLAEIDARKNAKIEIQNNALNNRLESSTKSSLANMAKTYLTYNGFNILRQSAMELIETMKDVEYRMMEISRIMEEGTINVNEYRDSLTQLAYDYGRAFDEVSSVTLNFARAGFDANESLALTEQALLALNTAELDAEEATDGLISVMAQWGMDTGTAAEQAENLGSVIDKINKVADNFPTTSADLLDALKRTSQGFNLAGASIDETIALLVAAERSAQRGGKVIGTALANIVQQLKTEGRLNIAEELGLNFFEDDAKTIYKSVTDIFIEMSEKMQQLKEEGKGSSTEMQKLLELFTVFRRNIGAGLLSEISDGEEESTYTRALRTSIESLGYSAQENAKYMNTMEAATQQFNAQILKLINTLTDEGGRDIFSAIVVGGSEFIEVLNLIIEKIGILPTAIGAVTLAYTSMKTKLSVQDLKNIKINIDQLINSFQQYNAMQKNGIDTTEWLSDKNDKLNVNTKNFLKTLNGSKASLTKYTASMVAATAKQALMTAATVALKAAMSLGLSAAITGIIVLFDNLINAEDKAMEKMQENIDATQEKIDTYTSEIETIQDLIQQYEELNKKENRTSEDNTKIYEIQVKINDLIKETGKSVDLVNGSYEEQMNILKEMTTEQLKQLELEKQIQMNQKNKAKEGISKNNQLPSLTYQIETQIRNSDKDYNNNIIGGISPFLQESDWQTQFDMISKWKKDLEEAGQTGTEAYNWILESLKVLNDQQEDVDDATNDYYNTLAQLRIQEWFINSDKIKSVEDYQKALDSIDEMSFDGMDGFKEKLIDVLENYFPEFNDQTELSSGNLDKLDTIINNNLSSLQKYADSYAVLRNAQDEYNKTGYLSISMLENLINNNLLQYLSIQNGQLQINAQSMLDLAESKKVATIEALQDAAALDIEKAAMGDVDNMSIIAKGALAKFSQQTNTAGNEAVTATSKIAGLAGSLQATADAFEGKLGEGVDLDTFKRNVSAIISAYQGVADSIGKIDIKTASYNPQTTGGSSSTRDYAAEQAEREAEEAAKAAEEARKEALESFKDDIEERERLEDRWIKNKKQLGKISAEDEKYILTESVKRYKTYADEVSKLTFATEEEKQELRKKYLEEAEDLALEYFETLKDILDDEIDAIEDKYDDMIDAAEEMYDERISKIEEAADAEIEALNKVEDERDRIRQKEEYEAQRKELISGNQGVEYWEQRTGREAQLALAEAKKKVEELDREWEETVNEWSVEDQIKLIEERRDADIKATEAERDAYLAALEQTKQAEISTLEEKYQYEVDYFNRTGEIIKSNAIIQSQELFNTYKTNFIDPVGTELRKALTMQSEIKKTEKPATVPTTSTYTIKYGDTLSAIARQYGTTVEKILAANPYISNRNLIYAGKQLKIPTSHTGSKILKDGLVELQAGETVLNMNWAKGLDRMLGQFNNQNSGNTINNGNSIKVEGDLLKVEAKIEDKTDVAYLTKKIYKKLENKFDIKM